uniref:Uncharacterized protein n=1 Tax=Corethron hystrix TaxID=216773 RepID=A0A7S1BHP6_9STRA|mmetsp:Transcript_26487/g.61013  ORF Transcript_26487/g.61013 Transcript_26487/m.61013 type:complete len:207 (+) Transcript_26487:106-726(+)
MGSDNKPETAAEPTKINHPFLLLSCLVTLAVGTVIALLLFHCVGDRAAYEKKIEVLAAEDLHKLFLAVVVLGRTVLYVNFYPMDFKKDVKGNARADPTYYRTESGEPVVMETEGDLGRYNRANRSVHHMIENFGPFLLGIAVAGNVFPTIILYLACVYGVGRVLHQSGYSSGYGGHAIGFLLANILAGQAMDGLCLLVFLKGEGIM